MPVTNIKIQILGLTIDSSKQQLKALNISLGADDKSASINFDIVDPTLEITDKFFKWSRANKGIKLPQDAPVVPPAATPTNPGTGGTKPGTGGGSVSAPSGSTKSGESKSSPGKLEGIEDEPISFSAFLETIGYCENRGYPGGNLQYDVIFTGRRFTDFSRHPEIVICSGGYCSSASGAFQFIGGDPNQAWDDIKNLFPVELPGSFLPRYQNIGARLVIRHYTGRSRGAYNLIRTGGDKNIGDAADGLSWYWASLPSAEYGQPVVSRAAFIAKYNEVLKRRESQARYFSETYDPNIDLYSEAYLATQSWSTCKLFISAKRQVTINLGKHGNNEELVHQAVIWLVKKNGLSGSFCMTGSGDDGLVPVWRSKDFTEAELDKVYFHQAVFHKAGLLFSGEKMKVIPEFNGNPGIYVKPRPEDSPGHPSFVKPGTSTPGTGSPSTPNPSNTAVTTPAVAGQVVTGEKFSVVVKTAKKEYRYTFILSSTDLSDVSEGVLRVSGQASKSEVDFDLVTENYESITAEEYINIIAVVNNLNYEPKQIQPRNRIKRIESHGSTPLQLGLDLARESNLSIVANPLNDSIVLYDNYILTPKKLILGDILSMSFSDRGVTTEEPLYPVSVESITSDDLIQLMPRDSVDLSSVYNFIPDSLKKDQWLVNTIDHDLIDLRTRIELLKYIPVRTTVAQPGEGSGTGQGTTLTESQLFAKYETAVVKVGSASGCFISANGYILTAAHMEGKTNITLRDGRTFTATEIDINIQADVMLMKIDVSNVNFIPLAPDSSIYPGDKLPIYKIGHGWSTEDGRQEGTREVKDWDITASTVFRIADDLGRGAVYITADDKTVDYVNPGDSGCPWIDPYGLIVSCTSGGNRTLQEGAGKKDTAFGGDIRYILTMCDKAKVPYVKGARSKPVALSPGTSTPGGVAPGTIGAKVVAALNKLGKFSTSSSGLGRVACMWSVNKVLREAGLRDLGSNPQWVPSGREALQAGRGRRIAVGSMNGAIGGDVWIYSNSYHVGLFLNSTTIRSSSSGRETFSNDDNDGTLSGTYPMNGDGSGDNAQGEVWRLLS